MKYKEFSNPNYEQHFNTEVLRFWLALKKEAIKQDYPFIKFFLKDVLKEFKEMDKTGGYAPLMK
jgi:hypothetical protein